LGVDATWATVSQPGFPAFAHLGSNLDGSLFTEVAGDIHLEDELTDEQRGRLRALGWSDPVEGGGLGDANHTRVWTAPFDLDAACWHAVLTLVAVYGLDPGEPVLATIEPFG
jgi:hypothetical protein